MSKSATEEVPAIPATEPVSEDQLAEAVKEASASVQTIVLHKPIRIDGKDLAVITLDFDQVGFSDMENIERQLVAQGKPVQKNVAFSGTYCMYIAARAAGININDLSASGMHAKDYNKIVQATQNFLML